jgi:hypothetical protein
MTSGSHQYLKNNVHTYIEIYRDVRFKFYVFALESVDFAASSQCEPLVICNKDAAHLKAALASLVTGVHHKGQFRIVSQHI